MRFDRFLSWLQFHLGIFVAPVLLEMALENIATPMYTTNAAGHKQVPIGGVIRLGAENIVQEDIRFFSFCRLVNACFFFFFFAAIFGIQLLVTIIVSILEGDLGIAEEFIIAICNLVLALALVLA